MLQTKNLSILGARFVALLLPAFCLASAALAQPGSAYVTKTDYSGTYLNFSDASTWVSGVVPSDSANVTISNCLVTMDTDITLGTITILSSGRLKLASSTVTILDQLLNNASGGISDSGGSSTVIFTSTVADGGSGSPTIGGSNDVTLYNVQLNNGSVTDFHSGDTGEAETFITNELTLKGGAVVVNPPVYADGSTLKYDSIYTVGLEWTPNLSSGKGVPHDVALGTSASLDFGATASNYTCTGGFTLDAASASVDISDMTGTLTVDEGFTMGSTNSVTLNVPSTHVTGKLVVGGDLTFGTNTTLSGDSSNVEVRGNLANSLTGAKFRHLKFNGSSDQDITGNLITVDSLVVANTQNTAPDDTDVDFQANVDITAGGVFNPVDGTSKITGTFTMNSDATGTARIATLADAGATSDVHGDITFERYVPAVTDGYSFLLLGNYVKDATRLMWSNSFSPAFNMVMSFDEDYAVSADGGSSAWSVISGDGTTLLSDGTGYVVYTSANSSPTITATGGYNATNQSPAVTYSAGSNQGGGFNLLTNPFPSPIDGAQLLSENGLFSTYYIYDNASDTWKTTATGAPGTIDIGQSFYVQVTGSGNVSFNTSQITSGSNSFVREIDPLEEGFVGVRVQQEDGRYGDTYIRFHQDATNAFEWDLDATHRASGNNANPEIYSVLANGHKMHINTPGTMESVDFINLSVESGSAGEVSLFLNEEFPLPDGLCGLIEDLETGEIAALGGEPMVLELEPNTLYEDRFIITFLSAPVFESTASYCEGGVVHFVGDNAEAWNINWSSDSGELTGTGCVTGLEPGDYLLEATDPFSQCVVHSNISIEDVCMGDFNFNGERDITDLLILLVGIQPVNNSEGIFPETDCDCDGLMTTLDLLMFLPQFGAYCD